MTDLKTRVTIINKRIQDICTKYSLNPKDLIKPIMAETLSNDDFLELCSILSEVKEIKIAVNQYTAIVEELKKRGKSND